MLSPLQGVLRHHFRKEVLCPSITRPGTDHHAHHASACQDECARMRPWMGQGISCVLFLEYVSNGLKITEVVDLAQHM